MLRDLAGKGPYVCLCARAGNCIGNITRNSIGECRELNRSRLAKGDHKNAQRDHARAILRGFRDPVDGSKIACSVVSLSLLAV